MQPSCTVADTIWLAVINNSKITYSVPALPIFLGPLPYLPKHKMTPPSPFPFSGNYLYKKCFKFVCNYRATHNSIERYIRKKFSSCIWVNMVSRSPHEWIINNRILYEQCNTLQEVIAKTTYFIIS